MVISTPSRLLFWIHKLVLGIAINSLLKAFQLAILNMICCKPWSFVNRLKHPPLSDISFHWSNNILPNRIVSLHLTSSVLCWRRNFMFVKRFLISRSFLQLTWSSVFVTWILSDWLQTIKTFYAFPYNNPFILSFRLTINLFCVFSE